MGGFVKLDCGILESTLWSDRDQRDVFLTALLMASFHEVAEPLEQLDVHTGEPTGFVIPKGWYGFVPAAGIGIVRRALIDDIDRGIQCLADLGQPDPGSRTPDHEGRRLARVPGGFIVLNWERYRDRDYTSAERSRRWRQRQKAKKEAEARKADVADVADMSSRVNTRVAATDTRVATVRDDNRVQSAEGQTAEAEAERSMDPSMGAVDGIQNREGDPASTPAPPEPKPELPPKPASDQQNSNLAAIEETLRRARAGNAAAPRT